VGSAMSAAFQFTLPPLAAPGATLRIPAPTGETLMVPVPETALPGDKITMQKQADGSWEITGMVRPTAFATDGQALGPATQYGQAGPPPAQGGYAAQGGQQPAAKPRPKGPIKGPLGPIRPRPQPVPQVPDQPGVAVELLSTKGSMVLDINPAWAPLGAQRFLDLVDSGYYTDIAVYRAVPNFLVQFGVSNSPEMQAFTRIADDPLIGKPVVKGAVCFAASGANTRRCTICIFLGDYSSVLGKNPWETPIGMLREPYFPVLDSLFTGYGDIPQCNGGGPCPFKLEQQGNEYIRAEFPQIDFIRSAKRL